MTWHIFLYNKVQDKIIESYTLSESAPVPSEVYYNLAINGELEAYYLSYNNLPSIYWRKWDKRKNGWIDPAKVPELLKLTRMMLE